MQTNFQQVQGRNLITKTKKTNRNWQRYLTNQSWSNICGADRVETGDVAVVLLISYRSGSGPWTILVSLGRMEKLDGVTSGSHFDDFANKGDASPPHSPTGYV